MPGGREAAGHLRLHARPIRGAPLATAHGASPRTGRTSVHRARASAAPRRTRSVLAMRVRGSPRAPAREARPQGIAGRCDDVGRLQRQARRESIRAPPSRRRGRPGRGAPRCAIRMRGASRRSTLATSARGASREASQRSGRELRRGAAGARDVVHYGPRSGCAGHRAVRPWPPAPAEQAAKENKARLELGRALNGGKGNKPWSSPFDGNRHRRRPRSLGWSRSEGRR